MCSELQREPLVREPADVSNVSHRDSSVCAADKRTVDFFADVKSDFAANGEVGRKGTVPL